MIKNEPSADGYTLGAEIARFAEITGRAEGRCATCAFRPGTDANGSAATTMAAVKCILEQTPFECHERPGKLCAGFAALLDVTAEPIEAPWEHVCGASDMERGGIPAERTE
jgi:hypothetical protein